MGGLNRLSTNPPVEREKDYLLALPHESEIFLTFETVNVCVLPLVALAVPCVPVAVEDVEVGALLPVEPELELMPLICTC